MNQFDKYFDFRLAYEEEIDKIMTFIRNYWGKPNHILANDREFFVYEYCPVKRPNVYLAVDKKTDEIAAIHCLYFYEKEYIKGKTDLSTGMFLANPYVKVPFVGIELHKRVLEDLQPRSYISPGVNMRTSAPLLKRFLHHKVERMLHFYLLGDTSKQRIGKIINPPEERNIFSEPQEELIRYCNSDVMYSIFDDDLFKTRMPYKDRWYVERRYFNHPIYKYELFGISNKTVIVCREVKVEDATILRIVDILGDPGQIRYVGKALKHLIQQNNYEYIDLYEQKMNIDDLLEAGFTERRVDDDNIIPNYFEPFLQKNIEIWVNRKDDVSFCFKADGDQDRPNYR